MTETSAYETCPKCKREDVHLAKIKCCHCGRFAPTADMYFAYNSQGREVSLCLDCYDTLVLTNSLAGNTCDDCGVTAAEQTNKFKAVLLP